MIEYINLNIYISSYYANNNRLIKVLFKYITFIINNLRAKMLININILIFKNIDLIIFTRINYINNYNIIFKLSIILRLFIK